MSIKVYSFSKLYLQQKILVASLMGDFLSLDRIFINFRKTYLLTTRIYLAGVNYCGSWMQIVLSSFSP